MRVTQAKAAALLALAATALLLGFAAPASAAPPGLVADGGFLGPAAPRTLSRAEAQATWTPERIAAATPADLPGGDVSAPAAPAPRLLGYEPQTLKATILKNPTTYPNRVHGKLVGTFRGLGDYSCSATVATSGSGSLITTAGHCAYDVEHGIVATNVAFAPGYSKGSLPYGVWPVVDLIVTKEWANKAKLDYDFSMMRTGVSPFGTLQAVVGSRGLGFDQPRKQRLQAYGYPARGNKAYDGDKLVRCDSGYVPDPVKNGGPKGRGMHCDQQQGSSGGGWVAKGGYLVSSTSHGYPQLSNNLFFGPYYGGKAKSMYKAKTKFWPSIGPVKRNGKVPNKIGPKKGAA
jgi:hypothetical protein